MKVLRLVLGVMLGLVEGDANSIKTFQSSVNKTTGKSDC